MTPPTEAEDFAENEEAKKYSKHTNLFPPGSDKYNFFTQEEKDNITMLVRKEISEVERSRYNHEMIVSINKQKPVLEDEQKQAKRNELIGQHERVAEMFTRHIQVLEQILEKVNKDN